jgi:hypothetical protein
MRGAGCGAGGARCEMRGAGSKDLKFKIPDFRFKVLIRLRYHLRPDPEYSGGALVVKESFGLRPTKRTTSVGVGGRRRARGRESERGGLKRFYIFVYLVA